MSSRDDADVIIVGSGASAVHAAWAPVMCGARVLMLDVGMRDQTYAPLIPDAPFTTLRRTDDAQHRYFLGDRFEGVPFGSVRVGAQLTPPRAFVTRETSRLAPVAGEEFSGLESLALGGLASGWGAGVCRFTDQDLADVPIDAATLAPHYAAVEQRIGVSGALDDLTEELGAHQGMMPALQIDTGSARILLRYLAHRSAHHASGLRLGITRLAACSRVHRGRGPHPLTDMDFWADKAKAVYRPRWTLEELQAYPNFTYRAGHRVLSFTERGGVVEVVSARLDGKAAQHRGRTLILAAGVFGTARIVLRSFDAFDRPVPFVCNPYTYAPTLQPGMMGREWDDARHSLSQLTAVFAPPSMPGPPMHVSMYSYRSLLTFKLMKEAPLSSWAGRQMLPAIIPLFNILGIHHADAPTPAKFIALLRNEGTSPEPLRIEHRLSRSELERIDQTEALLFREMRKLGCFAFKRVRPGPGSSIHYAGSFPMAKDPGELQTSADGRLSGTGAVYLADGSLLRSLPAKGLTLTLMANADRIGGIVSSRL